MAQPVTTRRTACLFCDMPQDKLLVHLEKEHPLADRKTRVALLLTSYQDAVEAPYAETAEAFLASVGDSKNSARMLQRNISPPERLWFAGSYKALERCLDALRRDHVPIYNAVWSRWVTRELPRDWGEGHKWRALYGLRMLAIMMPHSVFVPAEIAENAGFLAGEAARFTRPKRPRETHIGTG